MTDALAREMLAALRELNRTLSQPTQVSTSSGDRSNDVFYPFQDTATITGTTGLVVWPTGAGKRFVCRGGMVTAIVETVLAATTEGTLFFADSGTGKVVAPIGAFGATGAAASLLSGALAGPFVFDLKDGVKGSVLGAKVQIKTSLSIVTGVIAVAGILWGTEVTA